MGLDIAADRKDKRRAATRSAKKNTHVCTQCGKASKPLLITKGSIIIELFAWLCFLVPGLIYSIWRHSSRFKGCPDCKTQTMVKRDSPIGKKLLS